VVGRTETGQVEVKVAKPEQILVAATRLFAARGFDGASLQDIAEEVGIRKPSLLYHYPSKDDLRRAVLESLLSRWNDVLPRLLKAATSGEDQYDAVVGETYDFFAADPLRARLLLRELLDRPDIVRGLVDTHVAPWVEVVAGYVRRGIERGDIHREVDPEAFVVAAINLIVSSVATGDCLGAMLSPARQRTEILRLAKAALFQRATR
jgi:TetR/AcrR family transcriptional regulator